MKRIKLSQGKFALVSDEDYESLNAHKWSASLESRGTKYYAVRRSKKGEPYPHKTKLRMHRVIMGQEPKPKDNLVVHNKNDDGLDNRRENLEIITKDKNMFHSKGWKKKGECYL